MHRKKLIPRDISWLSFNARVLQEANDPSVPLKERIRFLGIVSNNLDEFFRVRVATLRRMTMIGKKNMHLEENPQNILADIQRIVLQQQNEFARIWNGILAELKDNKIYLVTEQQLNKEQQAFVKKYFEEEIRANVIPLLIESIPQFPYLREKSIYLGVVMSKKETPYDQKYAIIEVHADAWGRFVQLPVRPGEHSIILMEDVIRHNLPEIFSYFGYNTFSSYLFKITKDAEIDIDNDISTSLIQKIEKGVKNRRRGKPVRFVYDKEMDAGLLEYLIRKLELTGRDTIIPGGRIQNHRHFMNFPDVFEHKVARRTPITHPSLRNLQRVTDAILEQDVMLHFPYHSFYSIIDLLREAAIDPQVTSLKITAYRLATSSKVVNALINAARNGKQVTVLLELRARFDEEANLAWKIRMEDEGIKVHIGLHNMKVHAKLCIIKKRLANRTLQYGFVSTGNLNEQTARVYGDHCLLTSNRNVMADINRVFRVFENNRGGLAPLKLCKTLLVSPVSMRKTLVSHINKEIKLAKAGKRAAIILKLNSISDAELVHRLYEAARAGVEVKLIVRSIFCAIPHKKPVKNLSAISIVDEILEHARVMIFLDGGKEKIYISSADWMVRNLDHRVEAAVPVFDEGIKEELKEIINIQLHDNVKARMWDDGFENEYVSAKGKKIRSQIETYNYLAKKLNDH